MNLYGNDMTPEQRIADVERQMSLCERNEADAIECPYCGQIMPRGGNICCQLFAKAAVAILRAWAKRDVFHQFEELAERIDKIATIN